MASTPDKTLNGKVAFVGGASRNLGGLISTTLGAEGALVAVHYNSESSRAKAEDVVAQINKGPGEAFAVQADLTKVAEVERVFEEVLDRFGKLDYSINTAGMVLKKPLTEITEEEYNEFIKKEIQNVVAFQEKIGLDVLVHGEPERNDMVQYFGERLNGFVFTQNGWVQSYGSR